MLSLLAVAAGLAAAWALQARVSLLTTHGTSMFPHFHTGDLAITTRSDSYRVGEIVAYKSQPNGAIVLHRIVRISDGRYTFKGDNNSWLDLYRPTKKDLVGRMTLRIPRAGVIADFTTAPGHTVFLVLGILVLLAGGGSAQKRRGARRDGRGREPNLLGTMMARAPWRPPDRGAMPNAPTPRAGPTLRGAPPSHAPPDHPPVTSATVRADLKEAGSTLGPALAVVLLAALLAMAAFSRPATRVATEKRSYSQSVSYDYQAETPVGPTYPDGVVTTGSPIFLRLVHEVQFKVRYRLDAPVLHGVAGSYSIDAKISGVGSWKGYLPLKERTSFIGDSFDATVMLDITKVQAMIAATQAETGLRGDNIVIDLVPHVKIGGFDGDVPITGTYSTPLSLKVTPLDVSLVKDPKGPGNDIGAKEEASYKAPVERVRNLSLVGRTMSVERGRTISTAGILGGSLWLVIASWGIARQRRRPEHERIGHRYHAQIVDVAHVPPEMDAVELNDMVTLSRVAEKSERMILHHAHDDGAHSYLVDDGGVVYRYSVAPPPPKREPVYDWEPGTPPPYVPAAADVPPPYVSPVMDVPPPYVPPVDVGTPPPYVPDIAVQSLDEALRLSPVTDDERAAFGVSDPVDPAAIDETAIETGPIDLWRD
ncbi:MAG: signal peptidase I [Acidimicrobiales bacterium]